MIVRASLKIWAIVPLKPLLRGKSRLAGVLNSEEREALAAKMFRHTLEVLTTSRMIAGVIVISRDTKALALAREFNVNTVVESGAPELNSALLRASEVVRLKGGDGVLVVPADLPLVTVDAVDEVVRLGKYHAMVVVVPDRAEDGTNMMLVTPPGYIPFAYGPGSFNRHLALAEKAGATAVIHRSPGLGLDLDTPDDLAMYYQNAHAQETA
jgi:2-phospho-L-lactate guanylyltransferase